MKKKEAKSESETSVNIRKRRNPAVLIIILLLIPAGILFFAPRILSSNIARSFVMERINSKIEGTLSVQSWSFTWTRGIKFEGIRFSSEIRNICFEAGGLTFGFRIPDVARVALALRTTAPGEPLTADIAGELNLFRGRIMENSEAGFTPVVTDLNAQVKIVSLSLPSSFMLSAKQFPEDGELSVTGTFRILRNGIFDPEGMQADTQIRLKEWDIIATTGLFADAENLVEKIKALSGGVLTINMDGMDSIEAAAELAFWPSLMPDADAEDDSPVSLGTIDLYFDIAKEGETVNIAKLALDSEFIRAALSGNMISADLKTISAADIELEGKADLAATARTARLLAPFPAHTLEDGKAVLDFGGNLLFDITEGGDIADALSATLSASMTNLDIGSIAALVPDASGFPSVQGRLDAQLDAKAKGIETLGVKGRIDLLELSASGGFLGSDAPFMESVRLDFDLTKKGQSLVIDGFNMDSPLVMADVSGRTGRFEAGAIPDADIEVACRVHFEEAARLFPDTLKIRDEMAFIGGIMDIQAKCRNLEERPREARLYSSATLSDLMISGVSSKPISMKSIVLDLDALLVFDEAKGPIRIPDFSFSATTDVLSISINGEDILLAPVPDARIMILRAESELAHLMSFLRSFADIPDETGISGNASLSSRSALSEGFLKISEFALDLTALSLHHTNRFKAEKSARAEGGLTLPMMLETDEDLLKHAEADCRLNIESAEFLGINVSALAIPIRLAQGQAELDIETNVNEGTLLLPLKIDLSRRPFMLEIPDQTTVLSGVRLTDAMVNEMLGTITPLLRGCAVSTGTLGLALARCRLPIGAPDPDKIEFESMTSFNNITLAPAGLLFDVLSLVNLQREKLMIPDQNVRSEYRGGRFFTSDLILQAGGHDIILSGSAGLDETLDYTIRLPLTPAMLGKEAYELLKGQSISLPITGTVRKPVFDRNRFLEETAKAAADTGARKLIEKGIEEGGKLLRQLLNK